MLTQYNGTCIEVIMETTPYSSFSMSEFRGFLKRIPIVAPLPVATIMDIGVARPRAQGQAMMRTATALIRA